MRFIIFGVGAIGGTIAACLARAGHDVAGIARGRQLAAIRENGLTLRTPDGDAHVRFPCVDDPAGLDPGIDDAILLCVKSQDTEAALASLRAAGAIGQPVFCMQNGVANERMALRYFDHVYGGTVLMPSDYLTPGTVCAFGTPRAGILDIGRYPSGHDDVTEAVAGCLNTANISAFVTDDVMAGKYGKLLLNLANVLNAALDDEAARTRWADRARQEALAVYQAAGIEWRNVGPGDPRRGKYFKSGIIPGMGRTGSSSTQSLLRNAGSIETDYLNGEIALLGRLHGVPVPVNAALTRIGRKLVTGALQLSKVSDADMENELAAH